MKQTGYCEYKKCPISKGKVGQRTQSCHSAQALWGQGTQSLEVLEPKKSTNPKK